MSKSTLGCGAATGQKVLPGCSVPTTQILSQAVSSPLALRSISNISFTPAPRRGPISYLPLNRIMALRRFSGITLGSDFGVIRRVIDRASPLGGGQGRVAPV